MIRMRHRQIALDVDHAVGNRAETAGHLMRLIDQIQRAVGGLLGHLHDVVEPVTRRVAPRPAPKAPAVVAAPAPPPPPAPYKVETIRAAKRSEEVVD